MTGTDAPGTLDLAARTAALVDQNAQFAEAIGAADPDVGVPTCPEWTVRKLAAHVGRGDRWAATIVSTRSAEVVDPRTVADGKPPGGGEATAEWLRAGIAGLVAAVDEVGPDTPVWTFTGPKPAGWWVRRRLHEVAVHRADGAIALGLPYELDPVLGADGVGEWLDLLSARPARQPMLAAGTSMHLHATDGDLGAAGEWMVRQDGERLAWEHGHAKGTVAVRGRAADLLLALLRRVDAEDPRLEVLGDRAVFTGFLAATPF